MDGLELLVSDLFDYAGLFPPAEKPLPVALAISSDLPRTLARPHLLAADFVMPVPRLQELADRAGEFPRPFRVALLGGKDPAGEELERAFSIADATGGKLRPVSYERQGSLEGFGPDAGFIASCVLLCVEPNLGGDDWETVLDDTVEGLVKLGGSRALKVRGGGNSPITTDKLVTIIDRVARAGIRLKATSGLHHPILEPARYKNHLGFVNLALALHLKRSQTYRSLDDGTVKRLLDNASVDGFRFDGGAGFEGIFLDLEQLAAIKASFPFTIGSCDINEPDGDLKRLFGVPKAR